MIFATAATQEPRAAVRQRRAGTMALLGGTLVAFYILFPLDRGFPTVPLFGRPLSPAAAATLVVFGLLVLLSRGRILAQLRRRYCMLQSLYFGMLIVASLRAETPLVALHLSLVYYCTFVLNYVILLHVVREDGPSRLANAVAVAGMAAAAVGVLQGLSDVRFSAYEGWYLNYFQQDASDLTVAGARGVGTLNNPILYGTAMALLVPYAPNVRWLWLRVAMPLLLVVSAGLTASRTVLLVTGVFVLGGARVYRLRALWALALLAAGTMIAVVLSGGLEAIADDPRLRFLGSRVGLVDDRAATYARESIKYRQEALDQGMHEIMTEWGPVTWAIGRGQLTAASVGGRVSSWYNTVDNVFFGVFYEKGLIGLTVFLAAFGVVLRETRRASQRTLHWYAPLGLLAAGLSFNFDGYSTFNILAVCSMAITAAVAEGDAASDSRDERSNVGSSQLYRKGGEVEDLLRKEHPSSGGSA